MHNILTGSHVVLEIWGKLLAKEGSSMSTETEARTCGVVYMSRL
jgi:hypothetical protein